MDSATRKELRRIAHHLQPVVMVGDGGVSTAVISETNRALDDHELIKVKVNVLDREDRRALSDALMAACAAESVQRIGKILVLYRKNPEARQDLSNIARAEKRR